MANKIALNFNERGYNKALKAHAEYKTAKAELLTTIKSYGVEAKITNRVYVDTCEAIYALHAEGSTLPKGINKLKFLELMDISLVNLSQAVNKFNGLAKFSEKPSKDYWTTYATSEQQISEYKRLESFVEELNSLAKEGYIKNKRNITLAFANKIGLDFSNGNFKLNL